MSSGLYGTSTAVQEDITELVERAETAATNAETSATNAGTSETNAGTSETNAGTSENNASTSATTASNAASSANASATISTDNAGYSQEWANKAEDSLVSAAAGGDEVDDYSALHWAKKAEASAGTGLFTGLTDTPANYTSQGTKLVAVNVGETALEFVDAPAGGLTPTFTQTGTLADGELFMADSASARTRAFPAGVDGMRIGIKDDTGSAATNNVTIQPNGADKIAGVNADYLVNVNYGYSEFVFYGANSDWRLVV